MERIVDIPNNIERRKMTFEDELSLKMLTGMPVREEIIRCRDCFYWVDEDFCNNPQWHDFSSCTRPCTYPENFCSWAEKR